jgi:hypothetical protein
MDFNRKFYAVTPPAGGGGGYGAGYGGPSQQDINNAQSINEELDLTRDRLMSIGVAFQREVREQLQGADEDTQKVGKSLANSLNSELRNAAKLTKDIGNGTTDVSKRLRSVANIESQIEATKERQKEVNDLIKLIELEQNGLTDQQLQDQMIITAELDKQLIVLTQMLATQKKKEGAIKGYANTLTSIGKLPFFGPIFSKLLDIPNITKKMNEELEKGGSKWQILGAGISATFASIGKGIIGMMLVGLTKVIELVIQFDKKTFDIAKNVGVTVEKAGELQKKFVQIAASSANAGLTAKELSETYAQMSNSFGFLAPSSKEFAETATLIQKRLGASAEQMTALATQSALTGQTLGKTYGTIQATAKIEGARNKIHVSERQILEAIAKTSSTVLINFKGSAEALTSAVVRATKLGTTLDQVNKQGESLLDFESSINKEFEAQVLTGRDMNLTKARELALMGDTRGLMEELNKQGASYNQFMSMNVIARKAEAEAVGLSVEEYSKILLQQKQAQALGVQEGQSLTERYGQLMKTVEGQKKLKEELSEQELKDLNRASIQDRFNAALERFKDIIGSTLQGPVTQMLDKFIAFVGNTERMQKLANQIKNIFSGIASIIERFPGLLSGALQVSKILASLSIARAVASVVGSLGFVPVAGAALGAAAGVAMYGWLSSLTGGLTGGGSGAPDIPTAPAANAPGGSTGMTAPVNAAVAASPAVAANAASNASSGGVGSMRENGDVYLDGEKVGYIVLKNSKRSYGLDKA